MAKSCCSGSMTETRAIAHQTIHDNFSRINGSISPNHTLLPACCVSSEEGWVPLLKDVLWVMSSKLKAAKGKTALQVLANWGAISNPQAGQCVCYLKLTPGFPFFFFFLVFNSVWAKDCFVVEKGTLFGIWWFSWEVPSLSLFVSIHLIGIRLLVKFWWNSSKTYLASLRSRTNCKPSGFGQPVRTLARLL